MKKLSYLLAFLLLIGIPCSVQALPFTETVDVYTVGTSETISWYHTYDGSAAPETEAWLTIIAEGVDGPQPPGPEIDQVYFNGILLGNLTQQTFYNPGFDINPGPGALGEPLTELTTSIFSLDLSWLNVGANLVEVVIDPTNWIMEVETSTLAVGSVPEPATMLLLGTGLIGLAAMRRRFKK